MIEFTQCSIVHPLPFASLPLEHLQHDVGLAKLFVGTLPTAFRPEHEKFGHHTSHRLDAHSPSPHTKCQIRKPILLLTLISPLGASRRIKVPL